MIEGHRAGADVVKERLRDAVELGIEELTVFSFSTENWSRPREEVEGLMRDVRRADRVARRPSSTRRACGCASSAAATGVAPELAERMDWAEETTAGNERIVLYVAFNYGGRAEIVDAARSFEGESEEEFRRHLYAPEMHDPDLLIRTSGEQPRLQLPALAVRLLGAGLPRRALARLRARRAGGVAGGVRVAAAALRSARPDGPLRRRDVRGRGGEAAAAAAAQAAAPAARAPGCGARPRKRILVAIPWIVFAIAIVVAGGVYFAVAMIGIGVLCLREFIAMTEELRPIQRAAYVAVPALIVAAYFGTAFNVLLVLAASFPVIFAFGADRRHRDGIVGSMGGHPARHRLDRHPARPRRPAPRPPRPRRGADRRRPRRHLRRRHRRLRRRADVRLATGSPPASRPTRRSRA